MSLRDTNYLNNIQKIKDKYNDPNDYIKDFIKSHPTYKNKVLNLLKKGTPSSDIAKALVYLDSTPTLGQEYIASAKRAYYSDMASLDKIWKMLGINVPSAEERATQWEQKEQNIAPDKEYSLLHPGNVTNFSHAVAQNLGSLSEFILSMALGGGEGKLLTKGITKALPTLLEKKALESVGEDVSKEAIDKATKDILTKSAETNAKIGAMANVSAPQIGREYANQPANDKSAIKATLGGLATGALYTLSPFELLGKGISKEVTKVLDMPDIVKKYSGNDIVNSLNESVKQSAILGGASITSQLGSNQPINTQETIDQATLGAILGLGGKLISNSLKSKYDNSGSKIKKDFEDLAKENKISALQNEQRIALPSSKNNFPDISDADKFSKSYVERQIGKTLTQNEYENYLWELEKQGIKAPYVKEKEKNYIKQKQTIKNNINKLLPDDLQIENDAEMEHAIHYITYTDKPTVIGLENHLRKMKIALPDSFKEKVNDLVVKSKTEDLTGIAYKKHIDSFKKFLEHHLSTKLSIKETKEVLNNFKQFNTLSDIGNFIDDMREKDSKNKAPMIFKDKANNIESLMYAKFKLEKAFGHKLSYEQLKKISEQQKKALTEPDYTENFSIQDANKQFKTVKNKLQKMIGFDNPITNKEVNYIRNKVINDKQSMTAQDLNKELENFRNSTKNKTNLIPTQIKSEENIQSKTEPASTVEPKPALNTKPIIKTTSKAEPTSTIEPEPTISTKPTIEPISKTEPIVEPKSTANTKSIIKTTSKTEPTIEPEPTVTKPIIETKSKIEPATIKEETKTEINPKVKKEVKSKIVKKKITSKIKTEAKPKVKKEIKSTKTTIKSKPEVKTEKETKSTVTKSGIKPIEIIKKHLNKYTNKIKNEKDIEKKKILYKELHNTLKDKGVSESLIKTNLQALDRHIKKEEKKLQETNVKNRLLDILISKKNELIKTLSSFAELNIKVKDLYKKDNKLYLDFITSEGKPVTINIFDSDNINKLFDMDEFLKKNKIKIKVPDYSTEDYIKEDYIADILRLKKEIHKRLSEITEKELNDNPKETIDLISQYINAIDDLSYFVSGKDLLKFKLDDKGKKSIEDFDNISSKIEKDLFNIFGIKDLINKIFGKEISDKIKFKNIDNLSIEDLGGRDNIIAALKDYGIDATNYTDEQLKNTIKRVKGFSFFNAKDKSTLIGIATGDDLTRATLYHELFHIIENYKLLSDEDIQILKNHANNLFKDDPREWNEKIADDFSAYMIDNVVHSDDPILLKVYKKLKTFIKRLTLKFRKRTTEDIYRDLISGKYNKEKMPPSDLAFYYRRLVNNTDKYSYKLDEDNKDKFEEKIKENSGRIEFGTYQEFARYSVAKSFKSVSNFLKDFTGGLSPELHTSNTLAEENIVRKLASVKSIAIGDAVRAMKKITKDFNKEDKLLFEKHLIINDIVKSLDSHTQSFEDINHQWGYIFKDTSDLYHIKDVIQKEIDKNEKIKNAVIERKKLYKEIFDYLIDNDVIDEAAYNQLDTDNYFHRIRMLEFKMKIKTNGSYLGSLPKTDPLIDRVKSIDPYITNYIYSDLESFAQFYNLKRVHQEMKNLRNIGKTYMSEMLQDLGKINQEVKRSKNDNDASYTKKVIDRINYLAKRKPNGYLGKKYLDKEGLPIYTTLKISDIPHFYNIWTISDDMAQAILEGTLSEKEMENIEPHLATGIKKYDDKIIVNKNVITALKRIVKVQTPSHIEKTLQWNISKFKQFILFSPFRFPKYMFNNLTGDTDIAFAISPSILFKKEFAYQATKDLYNLYYNGDKSLSKELKDELELARTELVIGSNITAEEVSRIDTFNEFKNMLGTKPTIFNIGSKYFSKVIKMNNYREDILRLATFRYYKDKLKRFKNIKDAKIVTTVDIDKLDELRKSLGDDALAAKLAREAIGDYGNISPSGQWLRHNLVPFWSWTEINAPRYIRIYRNLIKESKSQALLSATFKTALLTSKISTLYALIQVWNMTMFPNVNDAINEENNGQLHLILPRIFADKDSPYYTTVRFSGALSDALDWIGLGNLSGVLNKMIKGEMTPLDVFKKVPSNALNKFINMSAPIQKTAMEDILGLSFFPDVANPRPIRDKLEHTLKIVGLGLPYKMLFSGQPTQYSSGNILNKAFGCIFNSIFYTTDLDSTNYYIVKQYVQSFLKEKNIQRPIMSATDKSNYAVSYRRALLYGDKQLAIKYLALYYSLGGTLQSMKRSLKYANPVAGIPRNMLLEFYKSLSPEDLIKVKQAEIWYKKIYINKGKFSSREKYEIMKSAWNLYLKLKKSK